MRIVITGVGALSPLGVGVTALWEGLLAGRHGIRPVTTFDASGYDVQMGGEVPGFEPADTMPPEVAARFGRTTQFAIAASRMAVEDAGLNDPGTWAGAGLCLGTTMGEVQELEAACAGQEGRLRRYPVSQIGAGVAEVLGLSGPNTVIPTACAAGNYSIGHAVDLLRDGRALMMLAGGVDVMAEIQYVGFQRLRSMAPDVPRPFSAGREGMMVSEGAGVLVLEPLDTAIARGARIYAEVLGYGLSCDAHHMTAPHPDGAGAYAAMTAALQDAGLTPEKISYVNAHGTGTPANDRIETLAIKRLLGDHAQRVPVTSIKAMLGHTMGAASALEAVVTALIVHHGIIPPTTNYLGPDPDCDLDYVIDGPRQKGVAVALSNSYAFGGNNASLVVGCPPGR
ncbi:MAG: beta-ketoacyl-[acyl-carrier-protein] synthase family protein [Candidatus Sericytochromatia bacterium]|uniref:Beta-ketoacyl-[acyl-carrier-protein] synthase family protein n=1 Tax=Candidatus Tanganyikabacteria bacterium TaxID=2961651 RepID=A0A938BLC0_9BACT|nr:beta-ketoacyl-[acyl-carrier-protein] synthase family protein [Candidatus Tanganyikabacteria bacterium]